MPTLVSLSLAAQARAKVTSRILSVDFGCAGSHAASDALALMLRELLTLPLRTLGGRTLGVLSRRCRGCGAVQTLNIEGTWGRIALVYGEV